MNQADRIAVRVKRQFKVFDQYDGIIIGHEELHALKTNPDPCTPPDYTESEQLMFCGKKLLVSNERNRLAFFKDLPL